MPFQFSFEKQRRALDRHRTRMLAEQASHGLAEKAPCQCIDCVARREAGAEAVPQQ